MRVFIAIELDHAMKRALSKMIDAMPEFRRDVRWVSPEQMHLTVKFLGDVPDGDIATVCEAAGKAAAESKPCSFTLDRCGCFPPRGKVRVIWGGGEAPEELADCVRRCEDAYADLGIAREDRPFAAHLTMGRVRDDVTNGRLRAAVEALAPKSTTQEFKALTVFESVLKPRGSQYAALARYAFAGA